MDFLIKYSLQNADLVLQRLHQAHSPFVFVGRVVSAAYAANQQACTATAKCENIESQRCDQDNI